MSQLSKEVLEILNQPGRIGVLGTSDKEGQPNIAYFGSLRPMPDNTITLGLGNNRSLTNLQENPKAVFFVVKDGPVKFQTPGYRIYLKVRGIHKAGPVLDEVKAFITEHAGAQAASILVAGVVFEVTEIRPLVMMG